MKKIAVFAVLICLAINVFSQDSTQRFRNLGENINRTLSDSNSNLQEYDQMLNDNQNFSMYLDFQRRYNAISRNLRDTEAQMDFLFRGNARYTTLKIERDRYENLIKQLEELKSEYDEWMRNVQ